jgi:hypothetical protein
MKNAIKNIREELNSLPNQDSKYARELRALLRELEA